MAYNPTLRSNADSISRSLTSKPSDTEQTLTARVRDIVLEENHPTYLEFGQQAIRGIHYELIDQPYYGEDVTSLPFAFNDSSFFKGIPVVGELVDIVKKPRATVGSTSYKDIAYYSYPINLWNNSHHNFQPDPKLDVTEAFLGKGVVEKPEIRNLQPFPGDLILEGRLGQSLRFSGFAHPTSILTDESNNGDPYGILRIGQDKDEDSINTYVENINKDQASIYLTSNHSIPLTVSAEEVNTFKDEDRPTDISEFKGNQVVIDSGRLVFHAKSDSIFLNSRNSTLIGSTTFNVDSTKYISVNAPDIYLGAKAEQPAVLGDSNEEFLRRLLALLESIAKGFNACSTPATTSGVLPGLGNYVSLEVNALIAKLESLKSSKVKVE